MYKRNASPTPDGAAREGASRQTHEARGQDSGFGVSETSEAFCRVWESLGFRVNFRDWWRGPGCTKGGAKPSEESLAKPQLLPRIRPFSCVMYSSAPSTMYSTCYHIHDLISAIYRAFFLNATYYLNHC